VRNVGAALIDVSLDNLDLLVYLNSFIATVMDVLFYCVKVALEVTDCLALVAKSLFMVSLASANLPFKGPDTSLQLCYHVLQGLKVTFTDLVVFNLLSVSAYYAVSGISFH